LPSKSLRCTTENYRTVPDAIFGLLLPDVHLQDGGGIVVQDDWC
jgi:hypothetical protein